MGVRDRRRAGSVCVSLLPARRRRVGSRRVKMKLCVLAVAVLIAFWAMKRHYADARADDLGWILSPTARLVGAITATDASRCSRREGYFSRERLFLIEKSCAGINFMVAAFGMLMLALLHRVGSAASAARVLGVSLLASYAAAVLVNAVRIAIAMWLAAHPVALSSLTAADVHRVEGIAVYFGGLVLLYELAQRLDRRVAWAGRAMNRDAIQTIVHAFRRMALPLAWYYAVTLAVPLANGAAQSGAFVGHALVVIVALRSLIVLAGAGYEVVRWLARGRRRTGSSASAV